MSWESGPAFPPGTLVLSPEQGRALVEAMREIAEAFDSMARAMVAVHEQRPGGLAQVSASEMLPDPDEHASEMHLRALDGGKR